MDAFFLYMLRRRGYAASLRLQQSATLRHDHGVQFSRHIIRHYLPETGRVLEAGEEAHLRLGVQRSVGFVRCFLEALCPPRGLALEMGCGTAPLMRACIASGRPCFSFDSDPDIVTRILQPLVEGPAIGSGDQSSSDNENSDIEAAGDAYDCPFD